VELTADNFRPGDKFKYRAADVLGFGVVISYNRALLITGGGRKGHSLTRSTVPESAVHMNDGEAVSIPYEIAIALRAAAMVLDC